MGYQHMSEEERRENAKKGGRAVQDQKKAHVWTPEEAREAGKKGGAALREKRGRDYFREIGKKGGEKKRENGAP